MTINVYRPGVGAGMPFFCAAALGAGAIVAAPACAQDAATWTGAYAGADVGYLASDDEAQEINGERFYIARPESAVGSVHLGWQRQFGAFVAGVEAEAGYADAASTVTRDVTGGSITSGASLGAFGSLAARFGFVPAEGWLLFGKIGATVGEVNASTVQNCPGVDRCGGAQTDPVSEAATDATSWGLLLGAGVERRLNDKLSVRLSYQFSDYNIALALPETDGPGWNHEVDQHAFRLGVSYRF